MMKVPNEPGLSPNNGLENVSLSDQSMASNPRKGQAKCPGAKTTSQSALPLAEVHVPCMGTHMAALTMFLALLG